MSQGPGSTSKIKKQIGSIPADIEETGQHVQEQGTAEPTAQIKERGAGHPHRDEGRAINETLSPIELPVTKDDSSEEILMTSTAYPGQEWKPAGFGGWEHY